MSTMTETAKPRVGSDEQRVSDLVDDLLREFPPASTPAAEFLGAQYDQGLAWVHFPEGSGGLGLNPKLQKTINEAIFAAGGPNPYYRNPIGYGMCGPTVVEWGIGGAEGSATSGRCSPARRSGASCSASPAAGPTSPACRRAGVRDGDEWIVNGQKVWTTLAHVSRWGLLVVRTDPDVPKHSGLTAFVVDMHAPGVEVRPLRQMTGEAEFNEVYFTDTRIPDAERLGEPGDGWRVSLTTLMNERVSIGGAIVPRGSGPIAAGGQDLAGPPRRAQGPGDEGRADEALDRGRGQPAHEPAGLAEPQDGLARAGGLDRQAGLRRVQQARSTSSAST